MQSLPQLYSSLPSIHPLTQIDLIASFLSGRNQKTIEAYRQDLDNFRQFLDASTIDQAAQVLLSNGHGQANAIALQYKTHLIEKGLQPATINRRLAALRSLVKLARTLGMVPWTLEIQNVKAQSYRDTKGPGKAGFKAMLELAQAWKKEPKAIRDTAILRLLYDLGLRRGEVISLDLEDVNFEACDIAILGKGKIQKINFTLPVETKKALRDWIKIRGEEHGPLFFNLNPSGKEKERLTANGLYKIIRKLGQKCGIVARPHGLRHSSITQALELSNGNYQAVARFSRHRNVQVITLYDDNRKDLAGSIAQLVAASVAL